MEKCFTSFLESFRYQLGAKKFNAVICPGYKIVNFENGLITGGMFRCVIIPNNNAFVIKIARTDTDGEYQIARELAIYKQAEKEKLQNWFARPLGCGTWDKYFYGAFMYVPHVGKVSEMFGKYGIFETQEEFDSCDYEQLQEAQYFIKSKKYRDLLNDFCIRNDINDLHDGNFGFSDNKNHIVFTDFAGYGGIPSNSYSYQ